MDYDKLKVALLTSYDFTERGYRKKFREAKPGQDESQCQFIERLRNFLLNWIELSKIDQLRQGLIDPIVRGQFTNVCLKELSVYLMERSSVDLHEMADVAEKYLAAHDKKLTNKAPPRRNNVNSQTRNVTELRCFTCNGIGHKAADCRSRPTRDRQEGQRWCNYC